MAAELSHTPTIQALNDLKSRNFAQWHGLAAGTRLKDVVAVFGTIEDEPRPQRIGVGTAAQWLPVEAEGFGRGLVVYVQRDRVLLIEGEVPQIDGNVAELLESLGEPDAKLDSYVDTYLMPNSEWVFAGRGLSLYLNPRTLYLMRAAVYAPTSLAEYEQRLRLSFQTSPRPLPRPTQGGWS